MLLQLLIVLLLGKDASSSSYDINFSRLGPVFDGVGAISGGGATSKLLYSLDSDARQKVFQSLFEQPGGVQILKVELGGDDQSTEGSEASHWPTYDNFDFFRGYENRLIREALKINQNLKICVLPWAFPGWVGDPIENPVNSTKYVVSWIKAAWKSLGVHIYCVGLWNERSWTPEYVITMRKTLNEANLPFYVKIVVGDKFQTPHEDFELMLAGNLTDFVDIIGVHYPGGQLPEFVQKSGKTLWASEDYSTMDGGFGCMARTLNWNYAYGNMTGTIVWHLASAFYKNLPYFGAGLMSPIPPFYQKYEPTPAFRQTSAHVQPGWNLLYHGSGSGKLEGGGTYVSYSNGNDLTIVIETMGWKSSTCYYSNPMPYFVAEKQLVSMNLSPNNRFKLMFLVEGNRVTQFWVKNGTVNLGIVRKDSLLTLTNVAPSFPLGSTSSVCKNCSVDHTDDFSGYKNSEEVRWLSPQKGTWLIYNSILIQTVTKPPVSWCAGEVNAPVAVMPGTSIKIDVLLPSADSPLPFVALQSNCSGCTISTCTGLFLSVGPTFDQGFLFTNFSSRSPIRTFYLSEPFRIGEWTEISLNPNGKRQVIAVIGNTRVQFKRLSQLNGTLVAVGTINYGTSYWDNLKVENAFA